jgi:hypothetical protein
MAEAEIMQFYQGLARQRVLRRCKVRLYAGTNPIGNNAVHVGNRKSVIFATQSRGLLEVKRDEICSDERGSDYDMNG